MTVDMIANTDNRMTATESGQNGSHIATIVVDPDKAVTQLPPDPLALQYAQLHGSRCAQYTWSVGHLLPVLIAGEVGLYLCLCGFRVLIAAVLLTITTLLLITVVFRLLLVLVSAVKDPQVRIENDELISLDESRLPVYTILVPLYREAAVAQGILAAIRRLEYPPDRLDIKLLLEADDSLTIESVRQLEPDKSIEVVLVPPGLPRTKPRACNYGLQSARGEFVVVFDAEDRPEPDQLLKAVCAFQRLGDSVVCLQAKLNYYNARSNLLTRWFTIEYTTWFDMVLPGIQLLNGPVPLGGTSNHFRISVLKDLRGWDPYNVTEDCDLGVRLAMEGYQTSIIDSTTWEEANCRVGNWIRQRSRWVKGYLQTYLVHTKAPFSLMRSLGARKTALFYLCITAVPLQQLLSLICWPVTAAYGFLLLGDVVGGRDPWIVVAGDRDEYRLAWKMLFLETGEDTLWAGFSIVGFVCSIAMLLANVIYILINLLACCRRGYKDLWVAAMLSPVYWVLGSIAAWKGAWQLIHRPHFWEKTVHGLNHPPVDNSSLSDSTFVLSHDTTPGV